MMEGLTIRELVTKLGFDIDDEKLDAFESRVEAVKVGLIAMTASAIAGAAALFAITKSTAEYGDELDAQASLLGLSVEGLQLWTRAAELGDLQAGEFTQALMFLNRTIGDAARGEGEGLKVFQKYGIALKDASGKMRSTEMVLADLMQLFNGVEDPATRASLAVDLFGRSGGAMGRFLADAGPKLERAQKIVGAFGFSSEVASAADEANDSFTDFLLTIRLITHRLGAGFLPVLKNVSEAVSNWALANEKAIKSGLDKFVQGITKAIIFGGEAIKWFLGIASALVRALGGIQNVVKLVGVAFAALFGAAFVGAIQAAIALIGALGTAFLIAWAKALIVPIAIAAAIAAIILIIEDLYVWIKGGDSVFGAWLGPWENAKAAALESFGAIIEGLQVVYDALKTIFAGWWDGWAGFWGMLAALWKGDASAFAESFKRWWNGLIHGILEGAITLVYGVVHTVVAAIATMIAGVFKVIPKLIMSAIPPSIWKLLDKAQELGGKGFEWVKETVASIPPIGGQDFAMTPAAVGFSPAMMARPGAQSGVKNEYNIQAEITVPPGTSEAQSQYLRESMETIAKEAIDKAARGVMQSNPKRTR